MAPEHIDLSGDAFLRLLTPADAPVVYETIDRNRERLRPLLSFVDRTTGPADTRSFIEETSATDGRECAYGIWSGDRFAGGMGLHTDPTHRSAMIGSWLDREYEGRGLVTKGARAPGRTSRPLANRASKMHLARVKSSIALALRAGC